MKVETLDLTLSTEDIENINDLQIPITKPEISKTVPQILAHGLVNGLLAGVSHPTKTTKWWGYELTYINTSGLYTMKLLHFENEGHTSMHYHIDKHETLLVASGVLTLETICKKERNYYKLAAGTAWVIPPGYAHRLIAADGPLTLVEASTYDSEEDSIRLS